MYIVYDDRIILLEVDCGSDAGIYAADKPLFVCAVFPSTIDNLLVEIAALAGTGCGCCGGSGFFLFLYILNRLDKSHFMEFSEICLKLEAFEVGDIFL